MGKHANGYLTPTIRASQGVFQKNMSPNYNRPAKCSIALRGMPRREHFSYCRCVTLRGYRRETRKEDPLRAMRRRSCSGAPSLVADLLTAMRLFQLDRSSRLFELRLECFRVFAAQGLLDGVRGLVDEGLRLLEAEARGGPDDLDDLDLLLARSLEHDVELGLLLLGLRRPVGCRDRRTRSYRRGGDAEALFEGAHELRKLENGHVLDGLHQLFFVYSHPSSFLSLLDYDCSVLCFCSAIWPSATTRPWTVLLSTVTSPVSGEEMPSTICASSCSPPGSLLRATTSASPSTRPPSSRPPLRAKDSTWSANSAISFALATGSSEKASAVGPTRNSEIPSTPASSAARLASVFFATTKSTPDSRLRRRRSVLLATSMPW